MELSAFGAWQPLEYCAEKQRRIEVFSALVTEYLRMESEHLRAVIDGRGSELEDELRNIRKQKDAAKQAIIDHQQEHGC